MVRAVVRSPRSSLITEMDARQHVINDDREMISRHRRPRFRFFPVAPTFDGLCMQFIWRKRARDSYDLYRSRMFVSYLYRAFHNFFFIASIDFFQN